MADKVVRLTLVCIASLGACGAAAAGQGAAPGAGVSAIRGWRGDWTARYPQADPVTAWDIEKGINVLWRVPTRSFSNAMPLVVGDQLLAAMEPHWLVCLDKMTGKLLWAQDGSSAEPVGNADKLRELVVRDPASGDVPWSKRKLNYGQWMGNSIPTPVTDGRHVWIKVGGFAACYDLTGKRARGGPIRTWRPPTTP